jgi:glutaredoxin 3
MQKIIIYTTTYCPYCVRAKALLDRKGYKYEEINAEDDNVRAKMVELAGGRKTVPQIFIGSTHVGGCDDLHAMEAEGKLTPLVEG